MTKAEIYQKMRAFNEERGYKTKGTKTHMTGVIVFTEDSFSMPFSKTERSYRFTSDNKAFLPNQLSMSVFADCLDGKDVGVRLDWYPEWKVEDAYIESEEENND